MLTSKPALSSEHPNARDCAKFVVAFAKRCKKEGLTQSEAIRQLVAKHLQQPVPLNEAAWGLNRDGFFPAARDTDANVNAIRNIATKHGISHGEVIRQLVRNYMDKP